MKTLWISLFLASWAATGCMTGPKPVTTWKPPATTVSRSAKPKSYLTADQVNESNAREVASALHQEMEQDSQRAIAPVVYKNVGSAPACKD